MSLDHGKPEQLLLRQEVPEAFCAHFCCAFVAHRCLASYCKEHECLWTAQKASQAVVRHSGKAKVPQEVYSWVARFSNTSSARRRS